MTPLVGQDTNMTTETPLLPADYNDQLAFADHHGTTETASLQQDILHCVSLAAVLLKSGTPALHFT